MPQGMFVIAPTPDGTLPRKTSVYLPGHIGFESGYGIRKFMNMAKRQDEVQVIWHKNKCEDSTVTQHCPIKQTRNCSMT